MKHVAAATSAAPIYFPPAEITPWKIEAERANESDLPTAIIHPFEFDNEHSQQWTCLDGGLTANNPSRMALRETRKLYPDSHMMLFSLGAGSFETKQNAKALSKMGLIGTIENTFSGIFDAQSDEAHEENLQDLTPIEYDVPRYVRLQGTLGKGQDQMDDLSQLKNWQMIAEKTWEEYSCTVTAMINVIKQQDKEDERVSENKEA
jgi:hypothetical protein